MNTESIWLVASDAQRLHLTVATPDRAPVGVVLLLHGMGEHAGRYPHVVAALCGLDLLCVAPDLRGHGRTPGPRGVAPSYDALQEDLDLVLAWIGRTHPGLPVALYGHSMGGNLVLARLLRSDLPASVRCAVAASPWLRLQVKTPAATVLVAKVVSTLLPAFSAKSTLTVEDLTRSEGVRARTRADPDYHFQVGARLFFGVVDAGESILAQADAIRIPLLVIVGTGDRVVSHEAVLEFIRRRGEGCESRVWPGAFHELHNEPEAEEVLSTVTGFLGRWMTERRAVPVLSEVGEP